MKSKNRISLFGMLFCVFLALSQIGCGGGSAIPPPPPPPPLTMTITTSSLPNGMVNAPYNVTLQSSGGTPPITWSGGGLPTGLSLSSSGTISGTPTAPGSRCFEVFATDSSTPPQVPAQSLCIGINQPDSSHNALLNGHYAYQMSRSGTVSGLKPLPQTVTAGSFFADGMGNVSGGVFDANGDSGFSPNQPLTGTYALGADNRGTMCINSSGGSTMTLAFSVGSISASGVAAKGHLIDFTESPPVSDWPSAGELELQDPSAFSNSAVSGSYAFELSGRSGSVFNTQLGADGVFTADGNGGMNTGNADVNVNGTTTSQPLTGTYDLPAKSTNGRGTGTLKIAGRALGLVLYVVSASKMLMVSDDPSINPIAFTGQALKQSGGPFNSSSLSAASVFRTVKPCIDLQCPAVVTDVTVGLETFDGNATVTVLQDRNSSGIVTLDNTATETYSVASNGRVTVTASGAPASVLYLVSAGTGFILNADGSTGFFEQQSAGPFSETSIDGNSFFGNLPIPDKTTISSGVATLKAGNISLTSDMNQQGTLIFGQSSQDTYVVAANGRATTGSGNQVIYIISPTKFLMLDVNPTIRTPGITVAEQ